MKKISEKDLKKSILSIKCSDDLDRKIMNNINKKRAINYGKLVFISSIMFVIIFGTGVVFAEDIKDFVRTFFVSKETNEDGFEVFKGRSENTIASINCNADFPEKELSAITKNIYKFNEIEEKLNTKILKNKYFSEDKIRLMYNEKINDKIAFIGFWIEDFTKSKNDERHNLQISFKTKYANNTNGYVFETGKYQYVEEYYLKSIDTNAYIIYINDTKKDKEGYNKNYQAYWIHNNTRYWLISEFPSAYTYEHAEEKFKDILNSFII